MSRRLLHSLAAFLGLALALGPALKGQSVAYTPYHFTTLFTNTTTGSTDGAGPVARFNHPTGVAVDAQGNLFVADTNNHTIRRIATDGTVTTFAGSPGQSGNSDGQGTAARFNQPTDLAWDHQGNLVVADSLNREIRRITPAGVVTTLAGAAGVPAHVDGPGSKARFGTPLSIAVDQAGNIWVADRAPIVTYPQADFYLRKITPDGTVSTLPKSPQTTVTPEDLVLKEVNALTADASGSVFAGNDANIVKITANGTVFGPLGPGSDQYLSSVNAMVMAADGGIFLTNSNGIRSVRQRRTDGQLVAIAGSLMVNGMADGIGGTARFGQPSGLALDTSGNLFVADQDNNNIRKIAPDGRVTTVAGPNPAMPTWDVLLAESLLDPDSGYGQLTADGQGNLYFGTKLMLARLNPDGTATVLGGVPGQPGTSDGTAADARFLAISGYVPGANGELFVTEQNAIRHITAQGVVSTLAGVTGQSGSVDGTGAAARFLAVSSPTLDANGDLLVLDQHSIRKITAQGVVSTLAGSPASVGYADGTGSAARFNAPSDMTTDAAGNIYVADRGNYVVRKVTPAGVVTTLAGSFPASGSPQSVDGTGSAARFGPMGSITCEPTTGNLFVSEDLVVRKITADGTVTTLNLPPKASLRGKLIAGPSGNLLGAVAVNIGTDTTKLYATQVWQITPAGIATVVAGRIDQPGFIQNDGTGAAMNFPNLRSLAMAPDGRIFALSGVNSLQTIAVGTPNRAPAAGPADPVSTPGNQPVAFPLPASDPDGDPLTYTITGTTGGVATTLASSGGTMGTFIPNPGFTGSGSMSYSVSDGYATSNIVTVGITVTPAVSSTDTTLANISTRNRVSSGNNVLIAGFVITGDANTPKPVLIRAVGPSLASQGVAQPLASPVITLSKYAAPQSIILGAGSVVLAKDKAAISALATLTGAFALPDGSNDEVLLTALTPGVYSATVSGRDAGDGICLLEVYDGAVTNSASHPVNISSRGQVGTGENTMIAGFSVAGSVPKKFLIRAVGPGLPGLAGESLAVPQIHLYQGPTVIQHITGWTNDAAMQAATNQTGAFPLPAGSADAAAIVTLAPGSYTAMVSSQNGTSGIALVEVYQLP